MNTGTIIFRAVLVLIGICLSVTQVQAQGDNWWYTELGISRSMVDIAGTEFNPVLPKVKLGVYLTRKILLEVQYSGSGDDTATNTNLEIDSITAAYLRLDSGSRNDMRIYVLLGNAETALSVKRPSDTSRVSDNYSDVSWGFGLEDQTFGNNTLLTLEYSQYYDNDEVSISAISFGFKYEF